MAGQADGYRSLYVLVPYRYRARFGRKKPNYRQDHPLVRKVGLSFTNLIISDTRAYRNYHCETYGLSPDKFTLIPAGADDRLFYPRPQVATSPPPFRVVYHGTFLPSHGLETMVRAVALLKDDADIQFEFWGEGPELPAIKSLAESLELTNLHFTAG